MPEQTLLYLAPVPSTFHELVQSLAPLSWIGGEREGDRWHLRGSGLDLSVELVTDAATAAERTAERHYPLLIVDCRAPADQTDAEAAHQAAELHELLQLLRDERDADRRYQFQRVTVLVGGANVARTDELVFDAGSHHVGLCLRDGSLRGGLDDVTRRRARNEFVHHLWDLAQTVCAGRQVGKTALCAAGGGISGIYYELGVLKCMQDAFANFDVRDFDMYFGISAGAIVTSMISNGFSVDEILELMSPSSGPALDVEIRLRDLAYRDAPKRALAMVHHLAAYYQRVTRGDERFSITGLASQFGALLGPLFDTKGMERQFIELLESPGHTNDFRELERELYIGTTDQDLREHVVFGDEDHRDTPISLAVRASAAIHPFFRSVEIDGRYYTDGFVTRTSNIKAAIERGAQLVFVLDPFLPLISETPGFHAFRSLFWGVLQDYKTVAYTRFDQVSDALLRQNPQVTCFTFLPSNRMRRLMATNPISTSHFHDIISEAYSSTYRRLRQLERKFGPRLAEHGIELELSPVEANVRTIEALVEPDADVLLAQR